MEDEEEINLEDTFDITHELENPNSPFANVQDREDGNDVAHPIFLEMGLNRRRKMIRSGWILRTCLIKQEMNKAEPSCKALELVSFLFSVVSYLQISFTTLVIDS